MATEFDFGALLNTVYRPTARDRYNIYMYIRLIRPLPWYTIWSPAAMYISIYSRRTARRLFVRANSSGARRTSTPYMTLFYHYTVRMPIYYYYIKRWSDLPGQVKRGWNTSRWRVVEWKSVWMIELIALSTFHPHPSRHYYRGGNRWNAFPMQHHKPPTPVQKSHRSSRQLRSLTIVVMRHFAYNYALIIYTYYNSLDTGFKYR